MLVFIRLTEYKSNKGDSNITSQNVGWLNYNPGSHYDVSGVIDKTRTGTVVDNLSLSDFFARPIEIASYQWSTSVLFYENFDPWDLFLSDPRVVNRINNYSLLSANLHLSFLLNGNAFYFGKLLANYKPVGYDVSDSGLIPENNIGASIRPHVYLDPTCSEGATMSLPFSWPRDALNLTTTNISLGDVSIRELNSLRHANGSTDPIRITVLAWMTNVSLSVPTSVAAQGLTPQAGLDEYGDGPVSKPATLVADTSSKLTSMPIIGPYARATQLAASVLATTAKMFGFSRAQTLEPVHEYVPRYAPRMAACDQPDTSDKLTIDSKQEVTVDTRVAGLSGVDEMSIKTLATRESYLATADWLSLDSTGQVLFSSQVTPVLFDVNTATTPNALHFTSCCFAATPFTWWRGSMDFRFQVVCSGLHKGRLLIQWDPAIADSNTELNVQYSRIVDIAEEKDFTITIGHGKEFGMQQVEDVYDKTIHHAIRGFCPLSNRNANGYIKVTVLNELTSPSQTATDVYLNVFVKCNDDIEFASPNYYSFKFLSPYQNPLFPQSGLELIPQSGMEDSDITKVDGTDMSMEIAPSDNSSTLDVYIGEKVVSFRTLLKRYNALGFFPGSTAPGTGILTIDRHVIPYVPLPPGNSTNSYWNSTYQANKSTLFTYLMKAYLGMRGASRWKIGYVGNYAHNGVLFAKNRPRNDGSFFDSTTNVTIGSTIAEDSNNAHFSGHEGTVITPIKNNPYLEVEVPYQLNRRFMETADDDSAINQRKLEFGFMGDCNPSGMAYDMYHAIGEDFSFVFYLGPPVLYDLRDTPV